MPVRVTAIFYPAPFDGDCVFRFLVEREHAEALLRGRIWLSTLARCRGYEQSGRGDPDEGTLHFNSGQSGGHGHDPELQLVAQRLGFAIGEESRDIVFWDCGSKIILPDGLLLCTTARADTELAGTFGRHCVRIRQPRDFFLLVTRALARRFPIEEAWFGPVLYASRALRGTEPDPGHPAFIKTPDAYASQQEVRMLWVAHPRFPVQPVEVSCPDAGALCELVADPSMRSDL